MKSRAELSASATSSDAPPDRLALRLIQHAAHRSPPDLAERLEEEWRADLAAQPGALSRLLFALGCCWATRVIAHDVLAVRAPVARVASGHGAVAAFAPPADSPFSRRTTVLLFIVGVHLIIIYGFSAGLVNKVIESLPPIIHGRLIYEPRAPKLPLPDPKPIAWQPVHAVWENLMPPESPPALTIDEIKPQLPPTSPPQPKPVTRVVGGPGPGFPNTGDFYPATSRQLGEAGVSAVQVCVDTHGRLTAEPQLKESSGSSRLDAGALALARAGSGHYRSTTEDGQPVASCYPFRIRFALK